MKKIGILGLLVSIVLAMLVSCGGIDWESDVEKIKNINFNLVKESESEKDLLDASKSFNTEIKFEGGDFEVEVIRFANYNKTVEDDYYPCQFIEFASEEDAESYYNLYIETRSSTNEYKLKIHGSIVIITNSEEAMKTLRGKFK